MKVDPSLLKRCSDNERKAQFELYKACYAFMLRICLRYHTSDLDAKQSLNDAFMKICTKLDHYKTSTPFELWIRRITINTCIDHYRSLKLRSEREEAMEPDQMHVRSVVSDQNLGEQRLDADELRNMIRQLPHMTRQVFNLAVLDGYPYEEVAELLEISHATCRWHVHAARKTLQEMIMEKSELTKSKAV